LRAFAALFAIAFAAIGTVAQAATLTVTVQDVRSENGQVKLALYATEASFSSFSVELASRILHARPGTLTVTFENLAPGQYAIAAYHDENGNSSFDTNFLGLPKEGYGFSNDAPAVFGPPSFDKAAVSVRDDKSETVFSIVY
jgi:uncharacterized protein (DUF2141 family)